MHTRKLHAGTCPWCGAALWYGVKEEPTGWKVFYSCRGPDGCGRERYAGRIDRGSVESRDEVFLKAERIVSSLG